MGRRQSRARQKETAAGAEAGPGAPCVPPSAAQGAATRWPALLAAGCIVLAGLAAYANSLAGPFIYDDVRVIYDNPHVRQSWPPWAAMRDTSRPVGIWSFACNYALHGWDVRGYHLGNLAIHLAAGLVLFGLVRRTLSRVGQGRRAPGGTAQTGQPAIPTSAENHQRSATAVPPASPSACPTLPAAAGLALAAALIWTVHPLQTQAVTYIVQRLESLMGLFYLLTLYAFVRAQEARRPVAWYAASVVFCALGMGTKEVMATAPLMVLWYDRVFVADSWRDLRRRWAYYAALAGTWVVLAVLMVSCRDAYLNGEVVAVENLSPWRYAASQPGVVLHYLKLSLWPRVLCLDYGWPAAHGFREIVRPLAAIVILLGLTVWCVFRHPGWGFLGGWFFAILSVTSSVVPIRDLAFEHRMYLPLAAVATAVVLAGYGAGRILLKKRPVLARRSAWAGVAVITVALALRTSVRNADYRSAVALWSANVAAAPGNVRAHNNLGLALAEEGRIDAAMDEYRKALAIRPDYLESLNNLGNAWAARGRPEEAIAQFRKALAIKADFPEAHADLGNMLLGRGQVEEAIVHYRKALESKPGLAQVHYNLGNALVDRGRPEEAIAAYRKALELKPDLIEVYSNLGNALATQGQVDAAIDVYRKGLQIRPDDAAVLTNLANMSANRGQVEEAIRCYRRAVEVKPGLLEAQFNLAQALAGRGETGAAVEHYRKALALAAAANNGPLAEAIRARLRLLQPGLPGNVAP